MPLYGRQGDAPMPTGRPAPTRLVLGGHDRRPAPSRDEVLTPGATASPDARRAPGAAGLPDLGQGAASFPQARRGGASFPQAQQGAAPRPDTGGVTGTAGAPGERPSPPHDAIGGTAAGVRYQAALSPLRPAPPRRTTSAEQHSPAAQRDGTAADDHVTQKVPASLVNTFQALHGADVSDVPVRRGRAVSRQATRLDAAAFSREGAVYLPDAAGTLNQAAAGALLAHELTHVVQQRTLGSALPSEASPEGRALEEQALATQRWFLGAAGAVPAQVMPPGAAAAWPPRAPVMRHLRLAPAASEAAEISPAFLPVNPAGELGVQRQPAGAAAPSTVAGPASTQWHAAYPAPMLASMIEETEGPGASDVAIDDEHDWIAELRTSIAELADQRHIDPDDPVGLDELAAKLYGRLRSKLRLELIVDRERAGLLTDFR